MNKVLWLGSLVVFATCLVGTTPHAQTTTNSPLRTGVVYKCNLTDGRVKYTNVPSAGCVVIFTYIFNPNGSQWRVLGVGGSGDDGWTLFVSNNWKAEKKGTQGWLLWDYAFPRSREFSQEKYKVMAEHVSVDCRKEILAIDNRLLFKDKTARDPQSSQQVTEREKMMPTSPWTLIRQEFCS